MIAVARQDWLTAYKNCSHALQKLPPVPPDVTLSELVKLWRSLPLGRGEGEEGIHAVTAELSGAILERLQESDRESGLIRTTDFGDGWDIVRIPDLSGFWVAGRIAYLAPHLAWIEELCGDYVANNGARCIVLGRPAPTVAPIPWPFYLIETAAKLTAMARRFVGNKHLV